MILCAFISVTLYYNYIYKVILFCNTTYSKEKLLSCSSIAISSSFFSQQDDVLNGFPCVYGKLLEWLRPGLFSLAKCFSANIFHIDTIFLQCKTVEQYIESETRHSGVSLGLGAAGWCYWQESCWTARTLSLLRWALPVHSGIGAHSHPGSGLQCSEGIPEKPLSSPCCEPSRMFPLPLFIHTTLQRAGDSWPFWKLQHVACKVRKVASPDTALRLKGRQEKQVLMYI